MQLNEDYVVEFFLQKCTHVMMHALWLSTTERRCGYSNLQNHVFCTRIQSIVVYWWSSWYIWGENLYCQKQKQLRHTFIWYKEKRVKSIGLLQSLLPLKVYSPLFWAEDSASAKISMCNIGISKWWKIRHNQMNLVTY